MTPERQLDPEALGDHIDRLYRAAWSLCGSREEAEDLVQETFARVLRKPRFLHSEDDLGYLLRVLRNTFFSSRRTAARRPQTTALPDDLDLVEDPSAVRPDARLESAELYAAISQLPDDFRDALVAIDVVVNQWTDEVLWTLYLLTSTVGVIIAMIVTHTRFRHAANANT